MPPAPKDPNTLPLPHLYAHLESTGLIRRLLELARDEDLGHSQAGTDITSLSMPNAQRRIKAHLNARQPCTIAGLAAVPELLRVFDPAGTCTFTPRASDGDQAQRHTRLAEIAGPRATVLAIERTLLNLISRLSGVATLTRTFADRIAAEAPASPAKIYDTRKTTPGLRVLEKYAVRCGGGRSHRLGLHDAVLIKDNHIAGVPLNQLASAVAQAATTARAAASAESPPRTLTFIEVEVDSLDQFAQLLTCPKGTIDIVLLDNMPPSMLREAVVMRNRAATAGHQKLELEASGGITLETVGPIAATGIDRISAGAITHQAVSVDIGLDVG